MAGTGSSASARASQCDGQVFCHGEELAAGLGRNHRQVENARLNLRGGMRRDATRCNAMRCDIAVWDRYAQYSAGTQSCKL